MYQAYFGLRENPFSLTPDPRFLFLSQRHKEGLAHLIYGMGEGGGFVQLTGEVGTGKTTLYRSVLEKHKEDVDVALVLNPRQSAVELLASICDELGVGYPTPTDSIKVLIDRLNRHLLQAHARGRHTVLIIDEAQNLDIGVLEQIRLLTNLETSTQKLLQIILVGQPELQVLLDKPELRQLAQRITARYHLTPLNHTETAAYILHRLRCAGREQPLFNHSALRMIHHLSKGVPRMANIICERSLLAAYAEQRDRIDTRLVKKATAEVLGKNSRKRKPLILATVTGVAVLGIAAAALSTIEYPDRPRSLETNTTIAPTSDDSKNNAPHISKAPVQIRSEPVSETEVKTLRANSENVVSLPRLLQQHPHSTDSTTAFGTLFKAWNLNNESLFGSNACALATQQGLRCIVDRGNLTTIKLFDRPAVLELIDANANRHHVALTKLSKTTVTVNFGSKAYSLPNQQLEAMWYGSFVILWRPPPIDSTTLQLGNKGSDVIWLRNKLDQAQGTSSKDSNNPLFDKPLTFRVQTFQRQHGLPADGIVGQKTLIKLNSIDSTLPVPLLSSLKSPIGNS